MSNLVKILVFRNEVESLLLDEILNEKEIPHLIRSYHDSVYDGLWQLNSGWGHLEAPEQFRDEIILIYEDMAQ
jgi:hypothetical protein